MKIAVIGLGDIARKAYLPILTQQAELELMLCTRNPEVLARVTRQYHLGRTATDHKDILAWQPDAVMIHSATRAHPEIAAFFLQQGIATFVDKPLADNAADCERLYELAEQRNTPLYIGFNRRHLPLINQHLPKLQSGKIHADLSSIRWEKHRYNQPASIRDFIFDDFIHPLDSINLIAHSSLDDCLCTAQFDKGLLNRVDIQWQFADTLYQASMNRLSGSNRETIAIDLTNQSYQFDSFLQGTWRQDNQTRQLHLKDWTPMLTSKGFEPMLQHWFSVVRQGRLDSKLIQRNLASHQLAEQICQQLIQLQH